MTLFHSYLVRVYQEDIDAGGIVYHSYYLKYAERARTEWLREYDITQSKLSAEEKHAFVVTDLTTHYLKPAFLDDELEVRSGPVDIRGIRLLMSQKIYRQDALCVDISVSLALINNRGRPVRLPRRVLAFSQFGKD